MMVLLYETGSAFNWSHCLGDLASYILWMEKNNFDNHNFWNGVARSWYKKAIDRNPNEGLLYNRLGSLSRSGSLEQLSYYVTSLTCVTPFPEPSHGLVPHLGSIVFDQRPQPPSFATIFVKAHMFLQHRRHDDFESVLHTINDGLLDRYMSRVMSDFQKSGVFVAIACIACFFEYERGSPSFFRFAFDEVKANQFDVSRSEPSEESQTIISGASRLAFSCLSTALRHMHEMNVLSLVHVYLVFLVNCVKVEKAMTYIASNVPWSELCSYLNVLIYSRFWTFRIPEKSFPDNNIEAKIAMPIVEI